MGKHFGELAFIRGIIYYKISAHEQNPFAGALTHGLPNMWPRTMATLWTYLPVFILGYGVYKGCEESYHMSQRKNPKDYIDEVDPNPVEDKCKPRIKKPLYYYYDTDCGQAQTSVVTRGFTTVLYTNLKKKNPNEIYIKYSMQEDMPTDKVTLFQKSGRREKGKGCAIAPEDNASKSGYDKMLTMSPTVLYKNRLPISDVKYKDLKRLCDNGIIRKRYHHDYLNLYHGNVTDSLTLTDEDEEELGE